MAEAKETLPAPVTEEAPKVEVNQDDLLDLATPKEDDPIVQELTIGDDKKETKDDKTTDKTDKTDQTDKTKITGTETKTDIPATEESTETKDLKQRLAFYEMLYGEKKEQPTIEQPVKTEQPVRTEQPRQEQQRNLLDNVTVTQEDLLGLLSGEPERAIPVIKKFVATAMALTHQHIYQESAKQERTQRYFTGIQDAFYSKDKYEDLNDFRPLVKYAGDQIQQEYAARGQFKMPHELIDEIGKRARELKVQMLGQKPIVNKTVIKQGETGDLKQKPPPKEQFTNQQQKEMMDLLED